MKEDPIVAEVRKVREERASRLGFDIHRIIAEAQRRQSLSGRKIASFIKEAKATRPSGIADRTD